MRFIADVYTYLQQFSIAAVAIRLTLAVLFGGLIGYERERHGRAAGLRTHVLVCMGSTMATLIGHYCMVVLNFSGDPMRIGAQVLSGIGFLGAGTIISKGRFQVTGLTTAAGLWATASIGLAIGIGFYEAAIISTFLVILTMSILSWVDVSIIKKNHKLRIYMELKSVESVNEILYMVKTEFGGTSVQVTGPRSNISGNCGVEVTVFVNKEAEVDEVLQELVKNEHIVYALPSI